MKIEVITDTARFEELKDEWNNLLMQSNSTSIFLTWEWLYYWWLHFRNKNKLFIIIVRNKTSGQMIGIAPLYLKKNQFFKNLSLKKLKLLGSEKVDSEFLDFIIYPGMEEAVSELICKFLNEKSSEWNVLELNEIEESSSLNCFVRRKFSETFKTVNLRNHSCLYIKLPNDYELFLKMLGYRMRKNLRWATRELEAKHKISLQIQRDEKLMRESIAELFDLHSRRFISKNKSKSNFSGDKVKSFHHEISTTFLKRGWLKFYFLLNDKKPNASLYAFKYKDRVFCYQSGFDPFWHKWSIGSVLFGYAIKDSIKEGLSEFHFLSGEQEYKKRWTETEKKMVSLIILNKDFLGLIYGKLTSLRIRVKQVLKTFRHNRCFIKCKRQ